MPKTKTFTQKQRRTALALFAHYQSHHINAPTPHESPAQTHARVAQEILDRFRLAHVAGLLPELTDLRIANRLRASAIVERSLSEGMSHLSPRRQLEAIAGMRDRRAL